MRTETIHSRQETAVFGRILVALDNSDAARAAFVFASDWARHFDSQLWFIQLAAESHGTRRDIITDVGQRGRQRANQFVVSGATQGQRNQQLVRGIADAAATYGADLIIVGLDARRRGRLRHADHIREQLTAATSIPVLMAPRTPGRERSAAAKAPITVLRPVPHAEAAFDRALVNV